MAGVTVLMQIAQDSNFQNRVRYYLVKAAVAIMNEDINTDRHAARAAYASKVLAGDINILHQCIAVLTNVTIAQGARGSDIPDWNIANTDIEFQVNSQYNSFI